jgi:hypothetical protein
MNAVGRSTPGFVPVESFGVLDSNDVAAGITKPGELDAIKATV